MARKAEAPGAQLGPHRDQSLLEAFGVQTMWDGDSQHQQGHRDRVDTVGQRCKPFRAPRTNAGIRGAVMTARGHDATIGRVHATARLITRSRSRIRVRMRPAGGDRRPGRVGVLGDDGHRSWCARSACRAPGSAVDSDRRHRPRIGLVIGAVGRGRSDHRCGPQSGDVRGQPRVGANTPKASSRSLPISAGGPANSHCRQTTSNTASAALARTSASRRGYRTGRAEPR